MCGDLLLSVEEGDVLEDVEGECWGLEDVTLSSQVCAECVEGICCDELSLKQDERLRRLVRGLRDLLETAFTRNPSLLGKSLLLLDSTWLVLSLKLKILSWVCPSSE